jgi:hypothetical protein
MNNPGEVRGEAMGGGRRTMAVVLGVALGLQGSRAGADPALDYMLNCQGCHRADGAATPGSVPALAGSVARFLGVPGGREFLVQVPGVSQAALDDVALAALMNWLVERFDGAHVPPGFRPYTAAEIGALRRTPLTDVDGVRARLVAAMDATHAGGGPDRGVSAAVRCAVFAPDVPRYLGTSSFTRVRGSRWPM